MVDLVGSVVKSSGGTVVGEDLLGDVVDGRLWAERKVNSVGPITKVVVQECVSARTLHWN